MAKRKKPKIPAPPPPPPERRVSRRTLYGGAVGAALVIAVALVVVSLAGRGGGTQPSSPDRASGVGAGETATLLAGIPQQGTVLGRPNAPVTLVEFADPQCPYCAQWSTSALPEIVRDYVRTGKVKIEFHGMAFLGPDSRTGLAAAFAAASQNKLWNVLHLLYANQGVENAGWINEGLIDWIKGAAGVDGLRFDTERQSQEIATAVDEATKHAQSVGVTGTPTFFAGPTGGAMKPVQLRSLDADALRPTLDQLLAS